MCATCGCDQAGVPRIDGVPSESVSSPLVPSGPAPGLHSHVHEDGTVHWHSHAEGAAEGNRSRDDLGEPGPLHPSEHAHGHGAVEHQHHGGDGAAEGRPSMLEDAQPRTIHLAQPILAANDRQAERNRGYFQAHGLWVWNVVSSPGSGKTMLLQKTIEALAGVWRVGVVVGDLETARDAERLRSSGAQAVQITTGTLCHLDAALVARAITRLDLHDLDVLVIENVGNLVCPAAFDLGEGFRVVLLSVTEGEDKPLKYPPIFAGADVVLITKSDLSAPCEFQRAVAEENIRRVSPKARIFTLSARTGDGMGTWIEFLRSCCPQRS